MKLKHRKTRLSFVTEGTARYRGKEREIVVDSLPSPRRPKTFRNADELRN